MASVRTTAGLGITAYVSVIGLAVIPYLFGPPTTVNTYYGVGIGGPPLLALFAAVCLVAFLAGLRGRSDPALVAGITLVLGLFMLGIAISWTLAVTPDLVGGFTSIDLFRYHRWAVLAATSVAVIGAAGYARSVL